MDKNTQEKASTPESKERKTIGELFADYIGEYRPEAMEWGEPAEEEIW